MRHLIDPADLAQAEITTLITHAEEIMAYPARYAQVCKGAILATLFYEPSTRTRLSFESAMLGLGGSVLGFSSADSSSAAKGESVADTIRMISCYADICVMRHPKEGSALVAAQNAGIPVINAGDGGHQHPTQTLTDLLTIHSLKNRLTGLTVGFCGDLKFGRTVHSLLRALSSYADNKFILISPDELCVPDYVRGEAGDALLESGSLEEHIGDLDVLYMTRVQRERFFNEEDYVRLKDRYILDKQKLSRAKAELAVLHPLPRVNEIAVEVDDDPRAKYFAQARYGKFIRMALLMMLLRESGWRGYEPC
jgi:aspartate carbamoyltransferase catalytic subunit